MLSPTCYDSKPGDTDKYDRLFPVSRPASEPKNEQRAEQQLERAAALSPGELHVWLSLAQARRVLAVPERELQAILARHSVKPINPAGEKFDPHLHQAIAEVPAPGQAPGTVVAVVQTGYLIGDRLLRPAMVTVAKSDGSTTGANVDQRV